MFYLSIRTHRAEKETSSGCMTTHRSTHVRLLVARAESILLYLHVQLTSVRDGLIFFTARRAHHAQSGFQSEFPYIVSNMCVLVVACVCFPHIDASKNALRKERFFTWPSRASRCATGIAVSVCRHCRARVLRCFSEAELVS